MSAVRDGFDEVWAERGDANPIPAWLGVVARSSSKAASAERRWTPAAPRTSRAPLWVSPNAPKRLLLATRGRDLRAGFLDSGHQPCGSYVLQAAGLAAAAILVTVTVGASCIVTVHPLLFADVRINTPRGIDLANAA